MNTSLSEHTLRRQMEASRPSRREKHPAFPWIQGTWIQGTRNQGARTAARTSGSLTCAALLVACLWTAAGPASAEDRDDWPYWRGPQQNSISNQTGLPDDWNPDGGPGSNVAWKRADLGTRSTPVVLNDKLYLLCRAEPETPREGERVVCLDAKTGETLWENRFNVWLSDVPDTRVGWSSVVGDPETGNVYALGVCGYFQCLDGSTGKTLWSLPLHERFGLLSTYGGRTNFPIICEDLVIISAVVIGWGDMARPAHRFIAFDKRTGEVVWMNGTRPLPEDTTYSAPVLTVLNGQKALVFGSGDGAVWAFQPRTGKPIWSYPFSRRGLNVSPVVIGDQVLTGHSEENTVGTAMGSLVALNGALKGDLSAAGVLWKNDEVMLGKASPLVVGERVYCIDDRAKLFVFDLKTGEAVGSRQALGTVQRATPLYADGKIYTVTANGRWYILEPDDKRGVKVLKKGRLRDESCDASPIAAHGRVYITTSGGLYCLHDASKQQGHQPYPAEAAEAPLTDTKIAQVQVVPAEVLTQPGTAIQFQVRAYNALGQRLETPGEVGYSVNGPGMIDAKGEFVAATDAGHHATYVTAKVADVAGQARLRVVPPLPWAFDFEGMSDLPITWVGARYRHQLREVDGSKVVVKVTTIPKGTRSRAWFGPSDLHDYTIEAEVKGAIADNKMPDIGLIAQGYALDLQGANQKLQIRSWVPQLRMATTIPFSWEPDRWYRMKFQASMVDGKAVLRGKVWLKDQDEPEDWTIEATDAAPTTQGSPGLFGNAKDAELYLDNLKVYPNK